MADAKAKVKVESASAVRAGASVRWLEGVHHFQERVISTEDWRKAGLVTEDNPPKLREGVRDVKWVHSNNFTVPASDLDFLTDAEFARFIQGDSGLEVVPGDRED